MPRRGKRMRGGDFLGIGNFFKRTLPNGLASAGRYAIDKLKKPSTYTGLAGLVPGLGVPAGIATAGLKLLGKGRRRRGRGVRRPMRGGNVCKF